MRPGGVLNSLARPPSDDKDSGPTSPVRLRVVTVLGLALTVFSLFAGVDLLLGGTVTNGALGIERNVYEAEQPWPVELMTWKPDPNLATMPQIPAGVSAMFVRRPAGEGASSDFLVIPTGARASDLPPGTVAETDEFAPVACSALVPRLNQAFTLDGEQYWFLWQDSHHLPEHQRRRDVRENWRQRGSGPADAPIDP